MIVVDNVSKEYETETGIFRAVSNISFTVKPGQKLALLGLNGAGKSTLIRMLCGIEHPTSGRLTRSMSISWPLGLTGGLHPNLTGNDNIRFIARIYDKSFKEVRDFVDDFAELGKFLTEPIKTYSSGMQARLNFALSLVVEFECYLVDEIIGVGDQRFLRKSSYELFEKRASCALVMASHDRTAVKQRCTSALVLHRGRGKLFDDIDLALDIYKDL